MAVSFELNNLDFPPLSFSTVSKPVPSVPARYHLLLHVGFPVVLVLFPINLSLILPRPVMSKKDFFFFYLDKYFNPKTKFENFTTKTYNGLPLVCFLAIRVIRTQYYWFCH